MIALLLAATIGQLPILPPFPFNENSKADVATVGYLAELESFDRRVDGLQREINREPDEKRREVLRTQLDEYQRDVVPLLDVIRRAIGRMRAKERGQTDLAVLTVEGVVVNRWGCRPL